MTFQRFSTQAVRPNDHKNGILQSGGLNVKPNDSAAAWDQLTWILHQSTVYKPSDFFQISKYFNLSPLHGSCHLMFNGIVQNCKKKKKSQLHYLLTSMPFQCFMICVSSVENKRRNLLACSCCSFPYCERKWWSEPLSFKKHQKSITEVVYTTLTVYFNHFCCIVALSSRLWFVYLDL